MLLFHIYPFYVLHTYVRSFCGQRTKGAFYATSLQWHAASITHRPTSHTTHSIARKQHSNTNDRIKYTWVKHSKETYHNKRNNKFNSMNAGDGLHLIYVIIIEVARFIANIHLDDLSMTTS